jgi:hypothetical protein
MAVKFEFVMEDADAENLIWAIRDAALQNDIHILEYMSRQDLSEDQRNSYIQHLEANKAYTLGLIEQMKNTRVGD